MTKPLLVEDVLAPVPSLSRMLARALILRCPRCASRGLFDHWVRRRSHCPGCGYTMEDRPDFFFGAYILNLMLTLGALFSVLVSMVIFRAAGMEPPLWTFISVGVVCATVLPVFAYPFTYTVWAVVDLRSEPLEVAEIAEALDRLDAAGTEDESMVEPSSL